ncbi:hypothetical protein U0070_024007 [Myodes glareolus]|uniref:RRP4 S1 domain-containing protein n=1 Tax=Myodes glareolus TaxID=447135 RepID=A0AAW0H165_MYOGA
MDTGFMWEHGTYMGEEKFIASVAGFVERVNKLICVKALKTRYNWRSRRHCSGQNHRGSTEETNSRLDSILLLSSMNLPGGELMRRSAEDELAMRGFLQEGELISVEVQVVFSDGAVSLHTRSLKYGKLDQTYPTPEHKDEDAGSFIAHLELLPLSNREVISQHSLAGNSERCYMATASCTAMRPPLHIRSKIP